MNAEQKPGRTLLLVAVLFTTVAWAGYAFGVPWGRGPDESAHAAYGGFLYRHGRLPDPRVDQVFQAQHPPLYYAVIGALAKARPDAGAALWQETGGDLVAAEKLLVARTRDPGDVVLAPYPRRIEWSSSRPLHDSFGPMAEAGLAAGETANPAFTTEGFYRLIRVTGGIFLAALLWILSRVGRAEDLASTDGLGTLAAAAVVAVPQFAANFAFLNSDQFAVLFSAAGFAVLATGSDPVVTPRRALFAGILLGCGLASKLFTVGACIACGVYVLLAGGPWKRRLSAAAAMTAAALAIGAPWVVRQYMIGVGVDPLTTSGVNHPEALRIHPPDLSWQCGFVGELGRAWFASVGSEITNAGAVFETFAAAFPLLAALGGLSVALSRKASVRARAACAAFLIALGVQVALVVQANTWFSSPQGRYLHVLDAPGLLALAHGARHWFGDRARTVLSALVFVAIGAGLWVQHGRVLSAENPPRDRYEVAGFVGYVDAGAASAAARNAEANPPDNVPTATSAIPSAAPKPEDTVLCAPGEVAVRLPPLVPGRPYVVEVRLRRTATPGALLVVYLNELRLGGPFTPELSDDWIRLPFVAPTSAAADLRGVRLRVRSILAVHPACVAEVRISTLPLDPPDQVVVDGRRMLRWKSSDPARLPPLTLETGASEVGEPVRFDATGVATTSVPTVSGRGPAAVVLRLPEAAVADFKPHWLGEPRRNRGFRRASAFHAHVFEATEAARPVMTLTQWQDAFPAGEMRVVVFDEERRPLGPGRLSWTGPGSPQDAADGRLTVPTSGPDKASFAELSQAGPAVAVDAFRFLARPALVFPLAP